MTRYLIAVDGGGTGTRLRLCDAAGGTLATGRAGPSSLSLGVDEAWRAILAALEEAGTQAGIRALAFADTDILCGLAGAQVPEARIRFIARQPGFRSLALVTDSLTSQLGALAGAPGSVVAVGTGSVAVSVDADGHVLETGGWGYVAGDEGSGAWIGREAVRHLHQVLDGTRAPDALSDDLMPICGGNRTSHFQWLSRAAQAEFAGLAPRVLERAPATASAQRIVRRAGWHIAQLASSVDRLGALPVCLTGGLAGPLLNDLPRRLRSRLSEARGDAVDGAVHLLRHHASDVRLQRAMIESVS